VGAALPGETDEGVRDLLVDALVAMGPSAKPAIAGLVPLVADASAPAQLRTKVIGAVIASDPASPDVAAALVKAAGDPDMSVRIAAAHALGKLNPLPDDARSTLVRLARSDSKTETRLAAVRGLVTAGPRAKAAKPDLEALSTGTIPGVDLWAKVGLIAITGDVTKAGGVVRAGLDHKGFTTRTAAAEALLLVGPTAADVPALVRLLKDPSGPGKAAAATALGRIGPAAKDAVPRLADALTDGDAAVRAAAAEALGRIGPAALPAAAKLKEAARTDPATAAAVRKALDKLGVKVEAPPPKP
jgi:HEAT repeat protein